MTNQIKATASNQSDCKRNVDPTRPFLKGCFETGHMPYAMPYALLCILLLQESQAQLMWRSQWHSSSSAISFWWHSWYLRRKNVLARSKTCSRFVVPPSCESICYFFLIADVLWPWWRARTRAELKDGVSWWCTSFMQRAKVY